MEMSEDDLRERLIDLGYGPSDDLSRLHYYSLPSLPPLDTRDGGDAVVALADHHNVVLVVVDTTSRVISGEENSADTFQALYRHTSVRLKAAGRALARLDHAGHANPDRARGSSAKAADVDLIWSLTATDDGLRLTRTHQRISWVPERVDLQRRHDPLRHELVADGWPAGTKDTAVALDRLGVPLDASRRAAQQALSGAGESRRTEVIGKALKWRRQQAEVVPDRAGTTTRGADRNHGGNHDENLNNGGPEPHPEPPGTTPPSTVPGGGSSLEEPPAALRPEPEPAR
jgi:hypothetical protein